MNYRKSKDAVETRLNPGITKKALKGFRRLHWSEHAKVEVDRVGVLNTFLSCVFAT